MLHYVDDFVIIAMSKGEAKNMKSNLMAMFGDLGIPLEPDKLMGPLQMIKFLGIEIDMITMQLRLPEEKLGHLLHKVSETVGTKALLRRQLQSLVGLLQHACKVICPGRAS